jgi:hypothetical protein
MKKPDPEEEPQAGPGGDRPCLRTREGTYGQLSKALLSCTGIGVLPAGLK